MENRQILYSKKETLSDTHPPEEPDWSDLHPDLIYLISQKLIDIYDFVRFRVVCKRWWCAVVASDLPPQLPWIVDNCWGFEKGYLRFYSLLTGKIYAINVDQCFYNDRKYILGSAYNYIVSYNYKDSTVCSLFNPLTNEELSLPQAQIPFTMCVPSVLSPDQSLRYVCMTSNPHVSLMRLFFCQLGDLDWTSIHPQSEAKTTINYQNTGFALYDGMFYATDRKTSSTKVLNIATKAVVCVVPWPEPELWVPITLVMSFGERFSCYVSIVSTKPKDTVTLIYIDWSSVRDMGT